MAIAATVFDAYGTLLDVHSAMGRHAARIGPDWPRISQEWRQKHIEYTWVRSLAGPAQHRSFERLTDESLAVVAARNHITDAALLADLRAAYRSLHAYPEVPEMLAALRTAGMPRAILSNGDQGMLDIGVCAAGIADGLDALLSAETVGVYKPDPRVYQIAVDHFGVPADRIAFMSSNPWDAFGAGAFGFQVFWINRAGMPDEYDLGATATVLSDLRALPALLG